MIRPSAVPIVLLLALTHQVTAQTALFQPASARLLAMGDMGVASRDDDVLFYNPAQLVVARGMSVSGERTSSTDRSGALSSVTRFNGGGVAVGMTMAQDNTRVVCAAGPCLAVASSSVAAVAGLAQVYWGTRFGLNAKFAEEQISGSQATRGLVDAGVSRDFFRYLTAGLAVQNIGSADTTGLSARPLRTTLGIAGAGPEGPFDIAATMGASIDPLRRIHAAGGAELGWSWLDGYSIALRAGLRDPLAGQRAFTTGAGFTMDRLSIDYALETLTGSRLGHRVGLRIR